MIIESFKRREEARSKEILATNYNLASLITSFIGKSINGKHLPTIYEVFPSFANDLSLDEYTKKQEEMEAEKYKMQWMNFAHNFNAMRNKGGAKTQ